MHVSIPQGRHRARSGPSPASNQTETAIASACCTMEKVEMVQQVPATSQHGDRSC